MDILKQESRTPEYLQKNPNGKIPLLEIEPVAHEGGFKLSRYKNINGWLERVRNQCDHVPMEPLAVSERAKS